MMVIVIEDSPTQAAQLRAVLERGGHEVRVAGDGREGLRLCAELPEPPGAVVSDILMPGIDGYEVCRRIKADERFAGVPVMLLTSLGDPADVLRALAAGADNYCTKPYRPELLLQRVAGLARRQRDRDGTAVELGGETFDLGDSPGRLADVLVASLCDASDRYLALEESRRELEATNVQREELMRIVAHELRSPLQSLLLAADALSEEADAETRRMLAARTTRQVERMLRIIDDLSDVSSLDLGTLPIAPDRIELAPLVRDVTARVQETAPSHRFEIERLDEATVRADSHRIEQVLSNLLTNAVKYSPGADRVLVKLVVDGERARVSVTDFGLGIAEGDQKRVFDRYYRADSETVGVQGVGLGLFISRALIEKQGGEIGVDSELGRGSTFWFTLPCA